jgi:hypothetical protein
MENGRMDDYTNADLMAAILDVRDAAAHNHANLDARVDAIEPHGSRPAS